MESASYVHFGGLRGLDTLADRVDPHLPKPGRYGAPGDRLIYFERFTTPQGGINREKQIKGWKRIRKIALIVEQNPIWRDLSEDWGKPAISTWRPPNA